MSDSFDAPVRTNSRRSSLGDSGPFLPSHGSPPSTSAGVPGTDDSRWLDEKLEKLPIRPHSPPPRATRASLVTALGLLVVFSTLFRNLFPSRPAFDPSNTHSFLPHDLHPPIALASPYPFFSLSLSIARHACNSFRLAITRTKGCPAPEDVDARWLSNDTRLDAWIKDEVGPDTFQVQVDGSERRTVGSPTRFRRERCEWEFDVRLDVEGEVWFKVLWMHQNYEAFIDGPGHTMNRLGHTISPPRVLLPPYPLGCTHANPLSPTPHSHPPCTGPAPIAGTFLASLVSTPAPALLLDNTTTVQPPFEFVPHGCAFEHAGVRHGNHSDCFARKNRALLIGDSHARNVQDAAAYRFGGNEGMPHALERVEGSKSVAFGELEIDLIWNPWLGGTFDCAVIAQYDSITLAYGAHPTAFRCPTAAHYFATVSSLLTQIPAVLGSCQRDPGRPKPRYVYLTQPAWRAQREYGLDCRTDQRLEYFNSHAAEMAREAGWSVIDLFALTLPFANDTPDGAHYLETPAMVPLLDEWIEKTGICPSA